MIPSTPAGGTTDDGGRATDRLPVRRCRRTRTERAWSLPTGRVKLKSTWPPATSGVPMCPARYGLRARRRLERRPAPLSYALELLDPDSASRLRPRDEEQALARERHRCHQGAAARDADRAPRAAGRGDVERRLRATGTRRMKAIRRRQMLGSVSIAPGVLIVVTARLHTGREVVAEHVAAGRPTLRRALRRARAAATGARDRVPRLAREPKDELRATGGRPGGPHAPLQLERDADGALARECGRAARRHDAGGEMKCARKRSGEPDAEPEATRFRAAGPQLETAPEHRSQLLPREGDSHLGGCRVDAPGAGLHTRRRQRDPVARSRRRCSRSRCPRCGLRPPWARCRRRSRSGPPPSVSGRCSSGVRRESRRRSRRRSQRR